MTAATARTNGYRLLMDADIKAFLRTQIENGWTARQMAADHALALVAGDASADPRLLFNEKGQLLAVHDWPDELAASVEGLEFHENGAVKRVRFASKSAARRTILEVSGRIGSRAGVEVAQEPTVVQILARSRDLTAAPSERKA